MKKIIGYKLIVSENALINKERKMKKIIGYKLIVSENALILPGLVEGRIKNGWELYGYPFVTSHSFCQAMVKYEEIGRFFSLLKDNR